MRGWLSPQGREGHCNVSISVSRTVLASILPCTVLQSPGDFVCTLCGFHGGSRDLPFLPLAQPRPRSPLPHAAPQPTQTDVVARRQDHASWHHSYQPLPVVAMPEGERGGLTTSPLSHHRREHGESGGNRPTPVERPELSTHAPNWRSTPYVSNFSSLCAPMMAVKKPWQTSSPCRRTPTALSAYSGSCTLLVNAR
jgi:hypothetical protein